MLIEHAERAEVEGLGGCLDQLGEVWGVAVFDGGRGDGELFNSFTGNRAILQCRCYTLFI